MKRIFVFAAVAALALCLSACGTTSQLQQSGGDHAREVALYSTVVIGDFTNDPAKPPRDDKRAEYDAEVAHAAKRFGELLEAELLAYRMDLKIVHGAPQPGALLIDGVITRYQDGNAALRLLIGFGAGSSYFDALVRFRDVDSGVLLGTVEVDKNSWPLGGGIAAFQTGEAQLKNAAMRVAEELALIRGEIRKRGAHKLGHRPVGCGRGGPNCGDATR